MRRSRPPGVLFGPPVPGPPSDRARDTMAIGAAPRSRRLCANGTGVRRLQIAATPSCLGCQPRRPACGSLPWSVDHDRGRTAATPVSSFYGTSRPCGKPALGRWHHNAVKQVLEAMFRAPAASHPRAISASTNPARPSSPHAATPFARLIGGGGWQFLGTPAPPYRLCKHSRISANSKLLFAAIFRGTRSVLVPRRLARSTGG